MRVSIIFFFLGYIVNSCGSVDTLFPQRPFFCRINGKAFVADSGDGLKTPNPIRSNINLENSTYWLNAYNAEKEMSITFNIRFDSLSGLEKKRYEITDDNSRSTAYINSVKIAGTTSTIAKEGYFEISNIEGGIVANFEFTTVPSKKDRTVYKVTKGRVDHRIRY